MAAYNVLLVEGDPKESELYADLIREVADCDVDVMSRVGDPGEWMARVNYHLVVIDSARVDGMALLEQFKRFRPDTGVILVDELGSVEKAVAAIRLGAEDYLKKPFNIESFQLAVKRGLDRKTVFGDDLGGGMSGFLNLLNSCQMISATLEQEKIFGILRSYLSREVKSAHSAVFMLKEGPAGAPKEPMRIEDFKGVSRNERAMQEILDIALQAANPLPGMSEGGETFRFVERGQLTPGLFVFRFQCAGKSDYFCVCLSPERPMVMEAFESRLKMLRAQLEVTGKNIEQYMGVQHLVYVDDATGLYNTRYLNSVLDREISQSRTHNKPFAVLFIDADKFKAINDTHGHVIGTKLLNELGTVLKNMTRDSDTVFRYGGDEFVAVLSPCDLATAKTVAERIRVKVEKHEFLKSENMKIKFTTTIGVAIFPDHAGSKKEIIAAADHAMYAAKRKARNCVMIAEIPAPKAPGEAPAAAEEAAPEGAAASVTPILPPPLVSPVTPPIPLTNPLLEPLHPTPQANGQPKGKKGGTGG